jgi:hypothetical protein
MAIELAQALLSSLIMSCGFAKAAAMVHATTSAL